MTSSTDRLGLPVLDSQQIRSIEAAHAGIDLMRRAGKAAAAFLLDRSTMQSRVVLYAGPGNNGGDALACATELAAAGYTPTVVMLCDPARLPADAANALRRAHEAQVHITPSVAAAADADWLVDGLFGIGLKRPLDKGYSDAVRVINTARIAGAQVLSLDVPSGIDADTGALVGESVVVADHTLTFLALKPGLLTGPSLNYAGEVQCALLGLDISNGITNVTTFALAEAQSCMRQAHANSHKGTHGTLSIVGGANGMLGAALLASRAAMRMGAGKVKVAWLADPHPQVDPLMPEVMMRSASDLVSDDCTALVLGCGMGTSGAAVRVLKTQLKRERPIIIDADALNLIAQSADLAKLVQHRKAATIITPHPAEAARLLGASTAGVQSNRMRAARDLAVGYRCVAVLKGAGTVVDDGSHTTINTTGNPLLATAGTGDVLAGMIGALLAQGYAANDAARIGVALHGAAADALATRGIKRAVASDVIAEIATL